MQVSSCIMLYLCCEKRPQSLFRPPMLFDDPTIWNWFTEGSYHQEKTYDSGLRKRRSPHDRAHNMVQCLYFKASEYPTVFELVVILFVGEYPHVCWLISTLCSCSCCFCWWEFQLLSSTVVMPTASKSFSTRVKTCKPSRSWQSVNIKPLGFAPLFFWSQKWLNHAKAI